MEAELLLRVAADPSSIARLSSDELCTLLADPTPPSWVFAEAARRRNDERVIAHLFSHPEADPAVLESAIGSDVRRLERFKWHVQVRDEEPELSDCFANLLPERVSPTSLQPWFGQRLEPHLSLPCRQALTHRTESGIPSVLLSYRPLCDFLFLGDFLHYLTCEVVKSSQDLPVLVKVALALNENQPLIPYRHDADLRVRRAAREREAWSKS